MKKLLESQTIRKLDILFILSSTFEPQNINEIAAHLKTSVRTLLSTVNDINHDAVRFQQDIRIERHSRSNLLLTVSRNFSFFYFKLKYLEESILYQIIDFSFNHPYKTMQAIAEENHLSSASVYRKLAKLKTALNSFDLEFDAFQQFPIRGNEKNIRFFFLKFYWYRAQMFEWPFSEELRDLCLVLHDEIFKDQFETKTIFMKEKVVLWLAINIIRTRSGYHLTEEEMTEMNDFIEQNLSFLEFQAKVNVALSKVSHEAIVLKKEDLVLFYTLLLCDEDFLSETTFSLLTLNGHAPILYEEATRLFLKTLIRCLKRPLTPHEYHDIYKKLLIINMYAYFFPEKEEFFTTNYRFDYLQEHYLNFKSIYDKFYSELYGSEEKFKPFKSNPNLYHRYLLLLVNNLDITTFHPEIKIMFFRLESPYMNAYYQTKIQTLTHARIKFIPEFEDEIEVDLIITHTRLNKSDDNYFIMNIPATPWDWERLRAELSRIEQLKLKDPFYE